MLTRHLTPRYGLVIALCLGLFLYGILGQSTPSSELLSLPLGAVDPRAFVYNWGGDSEVLHTTIFNAFIANLPQLALSGIYFTYNGLFTCFLLGAEWASFGAARKGLRVSHGPRGDQRATYFLQLPYRIAVPLMVLSGLLHWLCSQSIFLVSVEIDDSEIFAGSLSVPGFDDEFDEPLDMAFCGYSPAAILAVVLLGVAMVVGLVVVSRRRFRSGMPVAGSCSAAISAMCHAPYDETGEAAATLPVKWGVTGTGVAGATAMFEGPAVQHCSFSSRDVDDPQPGMQYASMYTARSQPNMES